MKVFHRFTKIPSRTTHASKKSGGTLLAAASSARWDAAQSHFLKSFNEAWGPQWQKRRCASCRRRRFNWPFGNIPSAENPPKFSSKNGRGNLFETGLLTPSHLWVRNWVEVKLPWFPTLFVAGNIPSGVATLWTIKDFTLAHFSPAMPCLVTPLQWMSRPTVPWNPGCLFLPWRLPKPWLFWWSRDRCLQKSFLMTSF